MTTTAKKIKKDRPYVEISPSDEKSNIALIDRNVTMSNALTRGAHGLGLAQKRIIALALAKTNSAATFTPLAGWTITLTAADYRDAYEVSPTLAYRQLRGATVALQNTFWSARLADERGKFTRRGAWLKTVDYRDGAGEVDITFHEQLSGHLLALHAHFTTYKLRQAKALRSAYSWRLLETLASWKSKGFWVVSVPDFATAMDAPVKLLNNFADLRKRVIETATQELRENGWTITWTPESKHGKKITSLCFTFTAPA